MLWVYTTASSHKCVHRRESPGEALRSDVRASQVQASQELPLSRVELQAQLYQAWGSKRWEKEGHKLGSTSVTFEKLQLAFFIDYLQFQKIGHYITQASVLSRT